MPEVYRDGVEDCVDKTDASSAPERTDEICESVSATQEDSLQILDLSVNPAVDYLLDYFLKDGAVHHVLVKQKVGRDVGQMRFDVCKNYDWHQFKLALVKIFPNIKSDDIPCRVEVKREGNIVKLINPEDPEVGHYEIDLVEFVQFIREKLNEGKKALSIPKKFVPGIREYYREEKTDQELREIVRTLIPDNVKWEVGISRERTVKYQDVLFGIILKSLLSGLFDYEMEVEVKYNGERIEISNPNEPVNCILVLDIEEAVKQLRKINKNPKHLKKARILFKREILESEQDDDIESSQEIHPSIAEIIEDIFIDGKIHELKKKGSIARRLVGRSLDFRVGKIVTDTNRVLISRTPEDKIKITNPDDDEIGHYESSVMEIARTIRGKLLNGVTSLVVSFNYKKNPVPEFYRREKTGEELEILVRSLLLDGEQLKLNQGGNKIFGVEGVRITLAANYLCSEMDDKIVDVNYREGKVVLSSVNNSQHFVLSCTIDELVGQLRTANMDPSQPRFPSLNFEKDILDERESILVCFKDGKLIRPIVSQSSMRIAPSFCNRQIQIAATRLFPHIQEEYLVRVGNDGENIRLFNNDHPEYGYCECSVAYLTDMLSGLLQLPKETNTSFGNFEFVSQIDYRKMVEEILAEPTVLNISDREQIVFDVFRRKVDIDAKSIINSDNDEDIMCFLDDNKVIIRQGDNYSNGAYICDVQILAERLEKAFSTPNGRIVNPFEYYSPESTPFLREKGTQENGGNGSENEQVVQTPLQKLRLLIAGAHSNPSLWDNEEFVAEYIRLYDLSQANIEHYYTNSLILDLYRQGKFDAFPDSVLSLGAGYFEELQAHHVGLRKIYEREGIEVPKVYSLDISANMLLMGADSLEKRYPELFPKDSIEMIQADMRQAVTAVDIYFDSFEEDTVVKFGMIECSSMDQINCDDNAARRFARDICMLSRTGTVVKLVNREEISPTIIQELENEGFEVISKERDIVWLPDSEFQRITSIEGEERGRRIKEVLSNNFILIAVKKETLPTLKKVVKVMIGDTEDQFLAVEVIKRGDRIFTRVPTNIPLGLEDTVYAIEKEVLEKISALQDLDEFFRTVTPK